ncbi:MAG TPA: helix-turn-helix transcriptional regulator [Actinophytocola sp.]|uniref:helix-turn-helix domain-containing protein n=1 Tax=Actinophytocola sp. TaxID=1872138 RepID=UPI002DBEC1F9|nr:helix-turn-helix transcriptional regulator [Actinophytocola sp.]HEU5471341.1 helix-turn-helix transcriptional regulator [Actinophytocola sp.]
MHPFGAGTPRALTLAAVLREARERAGISVRELARRLQVAHTTVGRWEGGRTVPSAEDVSAVLACLKIAGDEREHILSLARGSAADDWLAAGPPGISKQLTGVMECERTARHITEWAPLVIPGVLQTSDYMRAMLAQGTLPPGEVETRVMLRMARRDAFTRRRDPTRLVALIGEPAIHGGIGGEAVMLDQLRHLLDVAELATVTVQIVSVSGEWHPGHAGPFMLYEFDKGMRPIVYLEHHRSGAFVVDETDLSSYRAAVETIRGVGLSPDESREHIAHLITSMEAAS